MQTPIITFVLILRTLSIYIIACCVSAYDIFPHGNLSLCGAGKTILVVHHSFTYMHRPENTVFNLLQHLYIAVYIMSNLQANQNNYIRFM